MTLEVTPICRQVGDMVAICLHKGEFNAARKRLEDGIRRIEFMHRGDLDDVPLSDLLVAGEDRSGVWEFDLLDILDEHGIEYVSQVKGRSWEQMIALGLDPAQLAWLNRSIDELENRREMDVWQ